MHYYTIAELKKNFTQRDQISLESYFDSVIDSQNNFKEFDVFLSHSSKDKELILAVKRLIEDTYDYRVYIDWINDRQLDRSRVNQETAEILRGRMRQSKILIYMDSEHSITSKWMPWELGFFDGYKNGNVAILVIREKNDGKYYGQEYLGLYPVIERHNMQEIVSKFIQK